MISGKGLLFFAFLLVFLHEFGFAQKPTRIEFTAATVEYDANLGKDTRRLLGNVVFTHGGAKMYCDSAYFYSSRNSLDAFSNVFINQGDTVHLYGDVLYYDGNTRQAKVRKRVKLINTVKQTTLTTEALDYSISSATAYYTDYAHIVNLENNLESKRGYYYTRNDLFDFQDSVVVTNPDYTIYSDTLQYNTELKTAYFLGPTEIFSDSSYIYCERGWYNTETDISQLNQNALVQNKKQTVRADSLYYEKLTGYGRAVNNVEIVDEGQNILLRGNKGIYYELTEYAELTEKAYFIQVSDEDSLFLHADTLMSMLDSSAKKLIKAFYGVRIFRSNMQGRCDSMTYSFADSVIRLYDAPVLWSEANQITADYIEIQTENQQAKKMYATGSAFMTSKEGTSNFNQIKGKNMICHFRNNEMYRVDVNGNGQTIYYAKDDGEIVGVNKAECSNLIISLLEGKPNTITFLKKPDATLFPIETAPKNELVLKGFKWLESLRPKTKEDIFLK